MILSSPSAWPDPDMPAILCPAPHRGYLDGPSIAAATPRPILFAVTPTFACHRFWKPVLDRLGQVTGSSYVPMRPGSCGGLRSLLAHLRGGGWVCIFPEGGIGTGQAYPGVQWLAAKSGAPIHRLRLHSAGPQRLKLVYRITAEPPER